MTTLDIISLVVIAVIMLSSSIAHAFVQKKRDFTKEKQLILGSIEATNEVLIYCLGLIKKHAISPDVEDYETAKKCRDYIEALIQSRKNEKK